MLYNLQCTLQSITTPTAIPLFHVFNGFFKVALDRELGPSRHERYI